jgi:hypothetical protein
MYKISSKVPIMRRSKLLCSLKRRKQIIDFNREMSIASLERIRTSLTELQAEIDNHNDSCLEECSFESRAIAFKDIPKIQENLDDDVISCILGFDGKVGDMHVCIGNHQNYIRYLERRFEQEADSIRRLHEEYERSVREYLTDVYYYISDFGDRCLDDEYKFVEQTL